VKVGDLVETLIKSDNPIGIITKLERSVRWGTLYHVSFVGKLHPKAPKSFAFKFHQMAPLSANR
jgi:hypothetical protein